MDGSSTLPESTKMHSDVSREVMTVCPLQRLNGSARAGYTTKVEGVHPGGLDGFRHLSIVAAGSCRLGNDVKLDQTIDAKNKLAKVIAFAARPSVAAMRPMAMAA